MRYLLTLLLTFNLACGEESARPRIKKETYLDQGVEVSLDLEMIEGGSESIGCSNLECMDDKDLRDKLLNLLHTSKDYGIFKDQFQFEPEPFEFEYDNGGQQG